MSPYYSHKYTNNLMCLNFSVKCECFGLFYTSLISVDEEVAGHAPRTQQYIQHVLHDAGCQVSLSTPSIFRIQD